MSKTKDMVIDDQNAAIEREQSQTSLNSAEREQGRPKGNRKNEQENNRRRDINRLTKETNYQLFDVLTKAMKEIQGDRETGETICDSELYCDMWNLQAAAFARVVRHDRKLQQYQDMEMGDLLKELYLRMQMLHHYGACHSRPLLGIAWTEENGRFVINLRDCAVNLEHTICDELRLPGWEGTIGQLSGTLYAIGYDPDTDCESGELEGHYEEALNFLCELNTDDPDATEHRDVTLYHRSWQHKDLLRDILAGLDVIGDMANEQLNK